MMYKEYPEYKDTFIIIHKTGYGVMENPYVTKRVMTTTDDLEEAHRLCEHYEYCNNTTEERNSSWKNNTYWIAVNTLTDLGKELFRQFKKDADAMMDYAEKNPKLFTKYVTSDGHTIYLRNSELFDNFK